MSLSLIIGDKLLFEANANPASEVTLMTLIKQSSVIVTVAFTISKYILYVRNMFSFRVIKSKPSTSMLHKYFMLTGFDTIIPSKFKAFNFSLKCLIFSFRKNPYTNTAHNVER